METTRKYGGGGIQVISHKFMELLTSSIFNDCISPVQLVLVYKMVRLYKCTKLFILGLFNCGLLFWLLAQPISGRGAWRAGRELTSH